MDMLSGGVEPTSEFTSKALTKRLMHGLFHSTRRFLVFKTMQFYGECGVVLRDGLFLEVYCVMLQNAARCRTQFFRLDSILYARFTWTMIKLCTRSIRLPRQS